MGFSGSLASIANIFEIPTCISLNNQPLMTDLLIDLNPDEYNQGLCYYQFMVNWDRCNGIFNSVNDW